jgi:hypothetical protein
MKIYFYNIGKRTSFALNCCFFFVLFIIDILFSNDIIKLIGFIKLTRVNYLNIIFLFFKKYLSFLIFFMLVNLTCSFYKAMAV